MNPASLAIRFSAMSGNATEEGLLTQIDNPSHSDIGRVAAPAGLVAGGVVYMVLGRVIPVLGVFPKFVLAAIVCLAIGIAVWRYLNGAMMARDSARRHAAREEQERRTQAELQRMNTRNRGG